MSKLFLYGFLLCPFLGFAQKFKKADALLLQNLQSHVQFLASDQLEGRRAGSAGEKLAVNYLVEAYQKMGIMPMGTDGYLQSFPIAEGKQFAENAFLKVNQQPLQLGIDFFPISNTAVANFNANAAIALEEANHIWFKDLQDVLDENTQNPHFDMQTWLYNTATHAKQKGAVAIFLYNSGSLIDNIQFNKFDTTKALDLPMLYVTKEGFKKYFPDESNTYTISANIIFSSLKRTAQNVIAFIDNHAPNTIILGAHLDHLGYNQDKNALDLNGFIRNGADDNASGTAALLETAKLLNGKKGSPKGFKNNNYLFIHFSAEELGLLGSKYWIEHPTLVSNFNFMLNMDMVGRYDASKKLTVGGFGTSSKWASILTNTPTSLLTHYDSAGTGPSDHASFYRKEIPVLFLFTGSHVDYHKASDDADKINYEGQAAIVRWVNQIIKTSNSYGKLDYLKTREAAMGRSSSFSVSLGVMPDYAYTGTGVRIEGASQGKLAERLGLQAGDVLLQLGDYKFIDVMSYMTALSKFKKGDTTFLLVKRGTASLKFDIQF